MENKMSKRYEFIEKTISLLRKAMEKNLPKENILSEMIDKLKEILKELYFD